MNTHSKNLVTRPSWSAVWCAIAALSVLSIIFATEHSFGRSLASLGSALENADYIGFVRVYRIESDGSGGHLVYAKPRQVIHGPPGDIVLHVVKPLDLFDDHDNYLAIGFRTTEAMDMPAVNFFQVGGAYQSIFPDFCEDSDLPCRLLACRSSLFTYGNLLLPEGAISGFTIVHDRICAVLEGHVVKDLIDESLGSDAEGSTGPG